MLTLQLLAEPSAVYAGKLLFNMVLTVCLNMFIAVSYVLLVQQFVVQSPMLFWITILLGSFGIAAAATILAAIIAKANTKGTLYPVLAFPIMLPLLLTVMNATRLATEGAALSEALGEFQILVAYTAVIIAVSVILFDFVWKD